MFSKWVIFILSKPTAVPYFTRVGVKLVSMLHLCHQKQRGSSLTVEWCRLRLKANHGHLQNQRVVWMVTARSRAQCLCEEEPFACGLKEKFKWKILFCIWWSCFWQWTSLFAKPCLCLGPPEEQQGLASKEMRCNRYSVDFKEWVKEWVNEQMNRASFLSRLAMFLLFFGGHLSAYSFVKCFLTYWK